jgi:toxin ParE1/3/4
LPKADFALLRSQRAERDLDDIWDYYAQNASPELAEKLMARIDGAAARVAARPMLGRARDDLLPGIHSIRVAPYLIFYRIGEDAIEVVRVLHDRRDLESVLAAEEPSG